VLVDVGRGDEGEGGGAVELVDLAGLAAGRGELRAAGGVDLLAVGLGEDAVELGPGGVAARERGSGAAGRSSTRTRRSTGIDSWASSPRIASS
jgi:hypothetical protein